jgi:hypothetical protein
MRRTGRKLRTNNKDKGGLIRQKQAKQHRKTIYRAASGEPCRIDIWNKHNRDKGGLDVIETSKTAPKGDIQGRRALPDIWINVKGGR